ncbi:MAG: hypothetical protein AAFX52_13875 [Pseudomonadota bacterium]
MLSPMFQECLIDIYRGEQEGEAIFDTILKKAADDKQRYVLGSLLQFETEGKARLRPLLSQLGISAAEDDKAKAEAASLADSMGHLSWNDQFTTMAKGIESTFLAKYRELATLVNEEEDAEAFALAKFMGDHEEAVMLACANLAAGSADPIAPVVNMLQFPLVKPAGYGAGPVWDQA